MREVKLWCELGWVGGGGGIKRFGWLPDMRTSWPMANSESQAMASRVGQDDSLIFLLFFFLIFFLFLR